MNAVKIGLAQINCTVGDLRGNVRKIVQFVKKAKSKHTDIVCFPELAVTGYPPEDLLLKPRFIKDNLDAIHEIVANTSGIIAVVGFVDRDEHGIYNAAAVIQNATMRGAYRKMLLPNYGIFDEKRYFIPGSNALVFSVEENGHSCVLSTTAEQRDSEKKAGGYRFGVTICEDIWHSDGPAQQQAACGARLILNINASPYHAGKIEERRRIIGFQAKTLGVVVAYTNLVGGQDELVFDGQSMVIDRHGELVVLAHAFKEELLIVTPHIFLPKSEDKKAGVGSITELDSKKQVKARLPEPLELVAEMYCALRVGLHDYVTKNGFRKVLVGLSGGIDSALVAVLAADALGKDNVIAVFMPSRYSSQESKEDAKEIADNTGIQLLTVSIEDVYQTYLSLLASHFADAEPDITEENLQARIRGNILMALSNKFGWLVLTTGNKSEMSTGYATLYGDMAGGFAVIKDVPKTMVYELARYRNSLTGEAVIPKRVLTKEPSAELKPGQKDKDTLPPYEVLDPILKAYIESNESLDEIVRYGYDQAVVTKVTGMVDRNEYKRRQAPPGIKVTPKAFGKDRRMPITNRYSK